MALKIEYLGGNCPVQSEGMFDHLEYYFKARGEHWSIELIDPETLKTVMHLRMHCGKEGKFSAGWMARDEAFLIIVNAYFKWKRSQEL